MMQEPQGVVTRRSSAAAASRESPPPQVTAADDGVVSGADERSSPRVVERDLFKGLGRIKSAILVCVVVIVGIVAAALVVYVTQRSIYSRIEQPPVGLVKSKLLSLSNLSPPITNFMSLAKHQRVRQYIREVLGESGPGRYPGAPIPRTPFIFSCQTDHCTKEGKHLRRNVAWSLDPCRDFHEYACSGDARRPSLREDALSHFLVEVRSVLGKWGQFRWTRMAPMHNKASQFFRACHGSRHDQETLEHDLGQYLRDLDGTHRMPEAWAADVSRTLQLFPVFEVSVSHLVNAPCIVLKEPDVVDGDLVLGMPGLASRRHKDIVEKLMKKDPKSVDRALQFAWSLRKFGGPPDDRLKPLSNISRTTVSALASEMKGEWRWERFLEAFFLGHLEVDDDTCVIVRSPSYTKHVATLTQGAKADMVRAFFSYALHLHMWPFWTPLNDVENATKRQERAEDACALLTYRLFNFAFVKHFNDTARLGVVAKAGMKEAVLRNSYRMSVIHSTDIPKDLRERVLDSIADSDKSYFNSMADVDAYYVPAQAVSVDWRHILTSYLAVRHSLVSNWLKHVVGSGGRVFDTNLDLVCHFEPEAKTLGIPMSIADMDVGGREFFLDISTVGLLMARSLYKIFQESTMWSNELRELRTCLQSKYSNLTAAEGQAIDGTRCVRTGVMDHVVLRAVHRAYKTAVVTYTPQMDRGHRLRDVSLYFPDLPSVSSEQLFYLLYAQSFCEPHEDVAAVSQKASWAPAKVRLNQPLADFESFADAFHCARGSPMNPERRCRA